VIRGYPALLAMLLSSPPDDIHVSPAG